MQFYLADYTEKKSVVWSRGQAKKNDSSKKSDNYYPFGLQTANSWTRDNTAANNFLYDGGNELNTTTGVYETMFRGYDPALGRFMQVDPLAHWDASLTPYHYSRNNPINFNDPTGLLEATPEEFWNFVNSALAGNGGTWSEDGGQHLFTEEEAGALDAFFTVGGGSGGGGGSGSYITNNGNGTGTGLSWYSGGGQFVLSIGSGPLSSSGGILAGPNSTMTTFAVDIPTQLQDVQWGLDPSTVGQNAGLSYPGPFNPMTYPDANGNRRPDYTTIPKSLAEYPAIGHDRRYDNLKISGFWGLVSDTRAIGADWKFVSEELEIASAPYFDPVTRLQGATFGIILGGLALPKTIIGLAIQSPAEIGMWYGISSIGVTNSPSK